MQLTEKLKAIRIFAMDVDGVLTDGVITLGAQADGGLLELKSFSARDGLALSMLPGLGLGAVWITGRVSPLVARRASELRVLEVSQWARNKRLVLTELAERRGHSREEVLYVGDDLNDLPAFEAAGVRVAVADAAELVRERADWITQAPGGRGAIREPERWLRPGAGAVVAAIEVASGVAPVTIGKPEPLLMEEAARAVGRDPREAIVIGDGLLTDLAAANAVGARTILMLTGVTTGAALEALPSSEHPFAVAADAAELSSILAGVTE